MPTCLRCRRETPPPEDDHEGDLAIRLDGRPMLDALAEVDRDGLDDAQREMLDRIRSGLCPVCGQAG